MIAFPKRTLLQNSVPTLGQLCTNFGPTSHELRANFVRTLGQLCMIFIFCPAPSCLPIVPHSSYFFKTYRHPAMWLGDSLLSVYNFAIFGALYPSCQRLTNRCRFYLLYKTITLAIDCSTIHFQSDIRST